VEEMKYITFYRENDNFDDILKDINLKKHIHEKISWLNYLRIGLNDDKETLFSYITLKYGDEMRTSLSNDYSPIPNVDYLPNKR
jgi:hypothetical protein